jgi:hypothetical protein
MQSEHRNNWRKLLLSLFFLFIPIIILGLWIYVFESNPNASQSEKVKVYQSYFPVFMRDNFTVSIIVLMSSLIAIVFASTSLKKANDTVKATGIIVIIVASLIVLLQLFSMM